MPQRTDYPKGHGDPMWGRHGINRRKLPPGLCSPEDLYQEVALRIAEGKLADPRLVQIDLIRRHTQYHRDWGEPRNESLPPPDAWRRRLGQTEDHAEGVDRREIVARGLAALSERERRVIVDYYWHDRTLGEIGADLGVTESRACQIKARTLKRMRAALRAGRRAA